MTQIVYQRGAASSFVTTRFDLFQTPLVAFSIGDASGYTPTPDETAARGRVVFQGGPENIRTRVSPNNHDITISFIIPEGYSDVAVGNVLAYGQSSGQMVPLVAMALTETVLKREAKQPANRDIYYPGNRMMITLRVSLVETENADAIEVNIVEDDFVSLPQFGRIEDVPQAENNPYNQFVVNRMGEHNHAALVVRGSDGELWTHPLWQNVHSPKYGTLNHLEGPRATWLWGGPYHQTGVTVDASTHGGLGYTDSVEGSTILGGQPYKKD